jgi:hypothetical protein
MLAPRRFAGFACFLTCILFAFASAQTDEAIAERILGPHWQQFSRQAGMIFAGTVLSAPEPSTTTSGTATERTLPTIVLTLRVDRPIAGVSFGQTVTIHEWAGAWSLHRPMRRGEHLLLFLYPLSRLGLTSPVDGSRGQIALDATGQNIAQSPLAALPASRNDRFSGPSMNERGAPQATIPVIQLERAIHAARGE